MALLDHVRRCNAHDLARYRPLLIGGARVGYVAHAAAELLRGVAGLDVAADRVALAGEAESPAARTAVLEAGTDRLIQGGLVARRRGERYAVIERVGGPALATVDRGAASAFGVINLGFHLNGWVADGGRIRMWIARRARDKTIDGGKLDNMVAGGQPAGITVAENVLKECHEEAGLGPEVARLAFPAGLCSYAMDAEDGLRRHAFYVYDLELPPGVTPRPNDDEVESFTLMPIEAVAEVLATDIAAFKYNCGLPIIDFMIRRGLIGPDDPDYAALAIGLRAALP